MTNEEKSQQYTNRLIDSFGLNGVPCDIKDIRKMVSDAYIAGANEALVSQWKRPENELPTNGYVLTFIIEEENNEAHLEIAEWLNGKYEGCFAMLVNLGIARIAAWMDIPKTI